ncbi:MAG: preprotein translocase subunit YajC [Isosphaeraceae bacterium]
MSELLLSLPLVFAQDAGNSSWFLPYVIVPIVIVYLMIIRPQKNQDQKRRAMLDAMKKNDKVLTNGGMYGTVISVDATQDRVVLRIDDEKGVKATFAKSAVARVIEAKLDGSTES